VSVRKIKIKMPATKVNLSQMVDLAIVTPRIGAVNSNVLGMNQGLTIPYPFPFHWFALETGECLTTFL
jgi:hypothetical protein